MRPILELSFMPSWLASGPETICWYKGNITPPKSYNKWGKVMGDFAQHLLERYGEDTVASFMFEVKARHDYVITPNYLFFASCPLTQTITLTLAFSYAHSFPFSHLLTHSHRQFSQIGILTHLPFTKVWNEPGAAPTFWTGTQADYFELYNVTARAIKAVSSKFRVGGPATGKGDVCVCVCVCLKPTTLNCTASLRVPSRP